MIKTALRAVALCLIVITSVIIMAPQSAFAVIINENAQGWADIIPSRLHYHETNQTNDGYNYLCENTNGVRFPGSSTGWISLRNNSLQETVEVVDGQTNSIDMQINYVGNHCTFNMVNSAGVRMEGDVSSQGEIEGASIFADYVKRTQLNITNVSANNGLTVSGINASNNNPVPLPIDWANTNPNSGSNALFYAKDTSVLGGKPWTADFTLSGIQNLEPRDEPYIIDVGVNFRMVNEWNTAVTAFGDKRPFNCVMDGPDPYEASDITGNLVIPSQNPDGKCPGDGMSLRFLVTVKPVPAKMTVNKYEPPSRENNGGFDDPARPIDDAISNAEACVENRQANWYFCNPPDASQSDPNSYNVYMRNGWNKGGLLIADGPYKAYVEVPSGWRVRKAQINNSPTAFTCDNPSPNQGRCWVTVPVSSGGTYNVDFWYERILDTVCANGAQLTTSPRLPERGGRFDLVLPFSASPGDYTITIDSVSPNIPGLDNESRNVTIDDGEDSGQAEFNNISAPDQAREYTVHWKISGDADEDCEGTIPVTAKPYLKVYDGDIRAGGSFQSKQPAQECASLYDSPRINPKASILTFSNERNIGETNGVGQSIDYFSGASAEFAVFALGEIEQFSSAGGRHTRTNNSGETRTTSPIDLTFGNYDPTFKIADNGFGYGINDPAVDNQKTVNFGGEYGIPGCNPDWFADAKTVLPGPQTFPNANNGGPVPSTVAVGDKIVTYVEGNVIIDENIEFAGSWGNNPNNIPSLYIIVKGNIHISKDVTRLDGVFVAQPSGVDSDGKPVGGRIYTCTTSSGGRIAANDLYKEPNDGGCRQKLTVTGAFIAQQVKFLRTNGTRLNSPGAGVEASSSGNIAEVFVATPGLYLTRPNELLKTGSASTKYDYIQSLPPIL